VGTNLHACLYGSAKGKEIMVFRAVAACDFVDRRLCFSPDDESGKLQLQW
jgi:hypothetical protein